VKTKKKDSYDSNLQRYRRTAMI